VAIANYRLEIVEFNNEMHSGVKRYRGTNNASYVRMHLHSGSRGAFAANSGVSGPIRNYRNSDGPFRASFPFFRCEFYRDIAATIRMYIFICDRERARNKERERERERESKV